MSKNYNFDRGAEQNKAVEAIYFILRQFGLVDDISGIKIMRGEASGSDIACMIKFYIFTDWQNFPVTVFLKKEATGWEVMKMTLLPCLSEDEMDYADLTIMWDDGVFDNSQANLVGEILQARKMVNQALMQFYNQQLDREDTIGWIDAFAHRTTAHLRWPQDGETNQKLIFEVFGPKETGWIRFHVVCDGHYSHGMASYLEKGTIVVEKIETHKGTFGPGFSDPNDHDVVWELEEVHEPA